VVELDSNLMRVMMTSTPPLFYWQPATLSIIQEVVAMRNNGIAVCYTIDAGPNVHVLCTGEVARLVEDRLLTISGVTQVLMTHPGGPATLE
jgi:diphosphomevalonate decarboxylase